MSIVESLGILGPKIHPICFCVHWRDLQKYRDGNTTLIEMMENTTQKKAWKYPKPKVFVVLFEDKGVGGGRMSKE